MLITWSSSNLYSARTESPVGQMMLSFEFSAFDLVLSLGVIVLIILFFTTLWKLNPSEEDNKPQGEEAYNEEKESAVFQRQSDQVSSHPEVQPSQVDSWRSTVKPVSQGSPQTQIPKLFVGATTEGSSVTGIEPQKPAESQRPIEHVEPIKQPKPTLSSKHNSKSSDRCPHHFGFLGGLPKNTPIPEECFGCQKIVDCLVTKRKS